MENFEGKNITNLLDQPEFDREPEGMAALREKVYVYRSERTALRRDDKMLTAWNGLALDEPRYLDAAYRAAGFLIEKLTGPNGRLLARWRDGDTAHQGKLDDYAFFAYGLLELYGTTFDMAYLARNVELANRLLELFFDQEHGGFYPYASADPDQGGI